MKYRIPVVITKMEDGAYMARSEAVRATATGNTVEEALVNLREAVQEMIVIFGNEKVFEDLQPETDYQVLEIAL